MKNLLTQVLTVSLLWPLSPIFADTANLNSEDHLLSGTRQLIFDGLRSGEGYFSGDGSQLIFQSEREPENPFYQIYLLDLDTGDINRVSPGTGKTSCAWIHPSENKVLFSSTHADPEAKQKQLDELEKRASGKADRYSWSFDEHYDIYETDANGKNSRNLTKTLGYDAEGSWSPDGKLIAFGSNRQAYANELSDEQKKIFKNDKSFFMEIYIMQADGTGVRRLTDTDGYDGGPFFSPDGQRIVWRHFTPDGTQAEIWTMNIDGSDKRQITRLGVMSWAPYFHPSSDYIIFATNLQGFGNFELYMVDAKGEKEPVRVTQTDGFDGLPVFSPNGKQLSWSSSRTANKKSQIFMANWNDAKARKMLGLDAQKTALATASQITSDSPSIELLSEKISAKDLRQHVQYLASEKLEGRMTGTPGEHLAGDYIASLFNAFGLQPAGDMGDWFQPFEFSSGVSLAEGNRLLMRQDDKKTAFEIDTQWRPLAYSGTGVVEPTDVVFAGYGISAPAGDGFPAYDSYEEVDVQDKWAMVLRFMPEDISAQQRQHLNNYTSLRYKAMLARDKGAKGLLIVSGPTSKVKNQLVKLRLEAAGGSTQLPVISITDEIAVQLMGGRSLAKVQAALDTGDNVKGFKLPGITLSADIHLKQVLSRGRNVVARLMAGNMPTEQVIVIGAHLDHIGYGEDMNSLADADDQGKVHYGADDNASGIAALLEISQQFASQKQAGKLKLKHDILFAAWSGEELGRLGSDHFASQYSFSSDGKANLHTRVGAYLNMDMIGRLDEQLFLQGVGSSSIWPGEIERRNVPIGLSINAQSDAYLPTDSTSFYLHGVPVLSAFTGAHTDYNTPRDVAERINYDGLERITRLMGLLTRSVAQREKAPDYVALAKPDSKASRASLRAYLGTIPDYAANDGTGVKLNGVAKAGPAEKGGLLAGDVIIEIAGKKIENIYDFTYALNALKVDQSVVIRILRADKTLDIEVTPSSRE